MVESPSCQTYKPSVVSISLKEITASRGPFCQREWTLNLAWIRNLMASKVWGEIIYPFASYRCIAKFNVSFTCNESGSLNNAALEHVSYFSALICTISYFNLDDFTSVMAFSKVRSLKKLSLRYRFQTKACWSFTFKNEVRKNCRHFADDIFKYIF